MAAATSPSLIPARSNGSAATTAMSFVRGMARNRSQAT